MRGAPVVLLDRYWMDLPTAAEHVQVELAGVVAAVARGELSALCTHRRRPGVWLVPMLEVQAWAESLARRAG